MDACIETISRRASSALMARLRPGWNGIESCLVAAPSPRAGPRSHASPRSRAAAPGLSTSSPTGRSGRPRSIRLAATRPGRNRGRTTTASGPQSGKPERLQKVLAHAGLGSRRGCEELILQGRVSINGEVVRQLGTRVDPAACPDRGRRRADPARVDGLLRRQQAQGLRLDQLRPFGPSARRRPASRDSRAGLHRRPARRGQHRV